MNNVQLIGNLTRDPELTYAAGSGNAICRFNIAVPKTNNKDNPDFINCTAFKGAAENIAKYFKKGNTILISSGSISTGSYEAKDGSKRYTFGVLVERWEFVRGSNSHNSTSAEFPGQNESFENPGSSTSFDEDITPIDDGDIPF